MEFVFSWWYIVMAVLAVGIVACMVVFFRMDKKDSALIEQFIKDSQQPAKEEAVKPAEQTTNE